MVEVVRRAWVAALVLSAALLAGCVGGDDPPAEAADVPAPSGLPSPSASVPAPLPKPDNKTITEVNKDEAIFGPAWSLGDWWRFDVSGQRRPSSTATLQVIAVADDHYKLGSDDQNEHTFNALHDGPWMTNDESGGIQKDTLALYGEDIYQDYIGFLKNVGVEWEFTLLGFEYTVTKAVGEVSAPGGPTRGIIVTGEATNDNTIRIEYAPTMRWITKLAIADAAGNVILDYTLTAQGTDTVSTERWTFTDGFYRGAQSPHYPVGNPATTQPLPIWESDGSGGALMIVFHLRNAFDGGQVSAYVLPPGSSEPISESLTEGDSWIFTPGTDAAGQWAALASAFGGGSGYAEVWVLQFAVTP